MITRHDLRAFIYCPRRAHLAAREPGLARPETERERGLQRRRSEHERAALDALGFPVLRALSYPDDIFAAARETRALLADGPRAFHKAVLLADDASRLAIPDLLIRTERGYTVRAFKLARRLEGRHREVAFEMRLTCDLLTEAGIAVTGAEVLLGDGRLEAVELPPDDEWEDLLRAVLSAKTASGWPRVPHVEPLCRRCPFQQACRHRFDEERELTLVPGVDGRSAAALEVAGIETIDALAEADPALVARAPGLGAGRAELAVLRARALAEGRPIVFAEPELPEARTLVILHSAGDPEEREPGPREFGWGVLVERAGDAPDVRALLAGAGAAGDRALYRDLLERLESLLDEDPDLRIVHYGQNARVRLALYAERYGLDEPRRARIEGSLFDLERSVVRALALPTTSYALPAVAAHAGFRYRGAQGGEPFLIARYHDWIARHDQEARREVEEQCEDDALAVRAVLRLLSELTSAAGREPPLPRARAHGGV